MSAGSRKRRASSSSPVQRQVSDRRTRIERCGVDGPVVGRKPRSGGAADPQLVHDLPRLGVDPRIVVPRLQRRQRLERAARELGAEEHGLQAGDERVASEHGHEPGHAGCGKAPQCSFGPQPQGGEVGHRLRERPLERCPGCAQPRDVQVPRGQRLADVCALGAEAGLDYGPLRELATRGRNDVEPERPSSRQARAPPGRQRLRPRFVRAARAAPVSRRAVGLGEHDLLVAAAAAPLALRRQRHRAQRVAEGEIVLLDGDDVREVRPHERELERGFVIPTFRTRTTSVSPGPTKRSRAIASVSCSRFRPAGCGGRTPPRSTRPGPTRAAGRAPSMRSSKRERKRVSSANRPPPAFKSPMSSQMQKVEPSRIVSVCLPTVVRKGYPTAARIPRRATTSAQSRFREPETRKP